MTAKGSVTPWMACGSRPVEATPQLGAFPTVGIRQGPGIAKGEAFSPLARPRQAAGWQITEADSGRNRTKQYQNSSMRRQKHASSWESPYTPLRA